MINNTLNNTMLQYLIVLLDDTSVPFCHYDYQNVKDNPMSLNVLKEGIIFAMKENLMVQFVFPHYQLTPDYFNVIDTVDNSKIVPSNHDTPADVVVFENWEDTIGYGYNKDSVYVIHTDKNGFFKYHNIIANVLYAVDRLNIVITDIDSFTDEDLNIYKNILNNLASEIEKQYEADKKTQINLLTDRLSLQSMNNCNAGVENITLAPNGKFYVCPAFYYADKNNFIGDLKSGLDIKNRYLYKIECAPICRECDAFQCNRCIWLNKKTTQEVNTPSYQQCVTSHIERNVSRNLLIKLKTVDNNLCNVEIKEVDYLDPFELVKNRK